MPLLVPTSPAIPPAPRRGRTALAAQGIEATQRGGVATFRRPGGFWQTQETFLEASPYL